MSLYLGAYHFDGRPDELLPAYERLLANFPLATLDVHVCVERDGGLTIFDSCPSKAVHDDFVRSDGFLGAVATAGLPAPRTEGLGNVHVAHVRQTVHG